MPPHRSPSSLLLGAGNPSLQSDGLKHADTPEPVQSEQILKVDPFDLSGENKHILLPRMEILQYYYASLDCGTKVHNRTMCAITLPIMHT